MKKFLTVIGCMCFGLCVFAYTNPKDFDWNAQEENKITSWINAEKAEGDVRYVDVCTIQKALIGKNDKNITYSEFKKIVNANVADKNYTTIAVPQFIYCVSRFRGFAKDVIADPDFGVKNNYIATWICSIDGAMNPVDFRKVMVELLPNFGSDYHMCLNYVNQYERNINSYTDEEIKSDLKKIKRVIYSKITVNEHWKKLVVKVELMLKSLD